MELVISGDGVNAVTRVRQKVEEASHCPSCSSVMSKPK